ncbi:hypothetical protein, partial [Prevotella sp. AGR2160]|uniref:hypothetical protein n=1 Tax=Prevotella sp. AGR2160 TaxID=1280674 RepID=UPI0005678094
KVSKKNSFSTLSYQVLWLGSGIRPPRTIPLGPVFPMFFPVFFFKKISVLFFKLCLARASGKFKKK